MRCARKERQVRSRYGSKKVESHGHKFDSKKERDRYLELLMLLRTGDIEDLVLQPRFEIFKTVRYRGETMAKRSYVADFQYYEVATGETVVEDVKSPPTRIKDLYRLKRQMFLGQYGDQFKFVET